MAEVHGDVLMLYVPHNRKLNNNQLMWIKSILQEYNVKVCAAPSQLTYDDFLSGYILDGSNHYWSEIISKCSKKEISLRQTIYPNTYIQHAHPYAHLGIFSVSAKIKVP